MSKFVLVVGPSYFQPNSLLKSEKNAENSTENGYTIRLGDPQAKITQKSFFQKNLKIFLLFFLLFWVLFLWPHASHPGAITFYHLLATAATYHSPQSSSTQRPTCSLRLQLARCPVQSHAPTANGCCMPEVCESLPPWGRTRVRFYDIKHRKIKNMKIMKI